MNPASDWRVLLLWKIDATNSTSVWYFLNAASNAAIGVRVASETGSLPGPDVLRHTYYKLFEMLTQNVELTSLNPRRNAHFNQKRIEAVGQMLG